MAPNATTAPAYICTPRSIVVILNNKQHSIENTHPNYRAVKDAIKAKAWDEVLRLIDIPTAVNQYSKGNVKIVNGTVYYGEFPIHNVVAKRILACMENDDPFEPLVNFLNNLMENPSRNSVEQLYGFLEHEGLPITPEGMILAYKAVRGDYKDKHSGKYDNTPGLPPLEMPRNQVDDNPRNHCSNGFHVGALGYVKGFGNGSTDRIVICEVNPRDIVSVPEDHSCMKVRCCRYRVISDYNGKLPDTVYQPNDDPNYYADGDGCGCDDDCDC